MIIHSYILRYSSRPSQTVREPFSLSPVGNPSGGCQLQPHGNLTPALSPGHSRVSIIVPPACHRHRRVLSPNGRIFILRLAESSASTPEKRNSVLRWLCVDNPVDIPEAAAVLPLCFPCSLLFLLDVCTQILSSSALMSGLDAICRDWDGSFFDLLTVPTCTVRLPIARDNV